MWCMIFHPPSSILYTPSVCGRCKSSHSCQITGLWWLTDKKMSVFQLSLDRMQVTKKKKRPAETNSSFTPFFIPSYKYVWTNRAQMIINMVVVLPNGGPCALAAWILRDRMPVYVSSHHLPAAVDQFVTCDSGAWRPAVCFISFTPFFFHLCKILQLTKPPSVLCSLPALCCVKSIYVFFFHLFF